MTIDYKKTAVISSWAVLALLAMGAVGANMHLPALIGMGFFGSFLVLPIAAWSYLKWMNRSLLWLSLLCIGMGYGGLAVMWLFIKRRQATPGGGPVGFFGELFSQCPECRAWFALCESSVEELERRSAYRTVTRRDEHFDARLNKTGETLRSEQIHVSESTQRVEYKCRHCNSGFERIRAVTST